MSDKSYRGAGPGCNTQETASRMLQLNEEIKILQEREKELDKHKLWVCQSIQNITDDTSNNSYPCNYAGIGHYLTMSCSLGLFHVIFKQGKGCPLVETAVGQC